MFVNLFNIFMNNEHSSVSLLGMNLRRASPEEKINICRKYFLAGLPLLPWVWIVNVLWFWREATKPDHIPEVSDESGSILAISEVVIIVVVVVVVVGHVLKESCLEKR